MDGLGLAPGLYSSLNSDKGLAVAGLPCLVNLGTFTACYFEIPLVCSWFLAYLVALRSWDPHFLRERAFWCWALLPTLPLLQVEKGPLPPLPEAGWELASLLLHDSPPAPACLLGWVLSILGLTPRIGSTLKR